MHRGPMDSAGTCTRRRRQSYVVTTGATTNATTSYANITGLVFNVAASTRYRTARTRERFSCE